MRYREAKPLMDEQEAIKRRKIMRNVTEDEKNAACSWRNGRDAASTAVSLLSGRRFFRPHTVRDDRHCICE